MHVCFATDSERSLRSTQNARFRFCDNFEGKVAKHLTIATINLSVWACRLDGNIYEHETRQYDPDMFYWKANTRILKLAKPTRSNEVNETQGKNNGRGTDQPI